MPKLKRPSYNPHRSWLTVNQLAEYFQIHRNTLRAALKEFKPDYDLHSLEDVLDFVLWYSGVAR